MKYKVNIVKNGIQDILEGTYSVCLFKNGTFVGEGNFSGWFAEEYYKGADIIAYYILNDCGVMTQYGMPIGDIKRLDMHFESIQIHSIFSQKIIEAKDDEEAFNLFWTQTF